MHHIDLIKTHLERLEYELSLDLSEEKLWLDKLRESQNEPAKLYTATFFGLDPKTGDEKFRHTKNFTDKKKAIEWLREKTFCKMPELHEEAIKDSYGERDMFCHLALSVEKNGCYEHVTSHVFSYLLADGEEKQFENKSEIIKTM